VKTRTLALLLLVTVIPSCTDGTSILGAPALFGLGAPADGAVGISRTPTFTWDISSGAVTYTLQISTDPGFANLVVDRTGILQNSHDLPTTLSGSTTHYWRVFAVNGAAAVLAFDASRSFTTDGPPPAPMMLLSSNVRAFTAPEGGTSPADQQVNLTNGGDPGTTLNWTATSDRPWLIVSPGSGSLGTVGSTTLTLSVNSTTQTEAWTGPTSTVGAPATGSSVHPGQAVWTGNAMLVWNGDPSIGGKYYDPVSDTWFGAVSTVAAPGLRTYFSAVWTGTEMIIWGGITFWGGSALNDGARYNPFTDTWTPMSTVGAPSPRWSHRAVWTGTHMIVWGGDSGGWSFKNSGGVYDPATDTWVRATSLANAPQVRGNHAAVWTGTHMLIWAGENGAPLNTGAFYDPVADAWVGTTSMVGVPGPSSHMNGVWTGTEMITWGLSGPTGARYNPALDRWTGALPVLGEPEHRSNHTLVWTGDRMIVWGGSSSVILNTGAIYRPAILPDGLHIGTITLTAPGATNSPQIITVLLTITP
jgi:hypothetical protein